LIFTVYISKEKITSFKSQSSSQEQSRI